MSNRKQDPPSELLGAIQRDKADFQAWFMLGNFYQRAGRLDEALRCYQNTLQNKPDHLNAGLHLAANLQSQKRFEEALEVAVKTSGAHPLSPDAAALLSNLLRRQGRIRDAESVLSPFIDNRPIQVNIALAFAELSKYMECQEEAVKALEEALAGLDTNRSPAYYGLNYHLGQLLDATGKYDRAFAHYQFANQKKPIPFDQARHKQSARAIINAYSKGSLGKLPVSGNASEKPVFIVGMPRSGTSLIEQIMASHPDVHGAGELMNIMDLVASMPSMVGAGQKNPECITSLTSEQIEAMSSSYLGYIESISSGALRVTDKMPGNFLHLGFISLLFPNARVIHCRRNPLDTCLSCYFHDFNRSHPYSTDLSDLGTFYRIYEALMEHWSEVLGLRIMTVQYEELVEHVEETSRTLIDFCGLDWDERCLRFYENRRDVGTASYEQVRKPIFTGSIGRWKHYESYLGPLQAALRGR